MASASSMPSLRQKQDLKRLLECSICLETFDNPRTLPCLHSFCEICLDNFVKGKHDDELKCPECRYKFTLNEEGKNIVTNTKEHYPYTNEIL
jgi:DNA-directed RNA polymerase subunit RPC12/RpoP